MNATTVDKKIHIGLKYLLDNDAHLLKVGANERSVTHRLGMYYQALFPKWHVDCEYDKNGDKNKEVEFLIRDLLARMSKLLDETDAQTVHHVFDNFSEFRRLDASERQSLQEQLENPELQKSSDDSLWYFVLKLTNGKFLYKKIIPDIIIHKRGRKNNYIAIETKKSLYDSPMSREFDILKLQALITDTRYSYKYGYFISLPARPDYHTGVSFKPPVPDWHSPKIRVVEFTNKKQRSAGGV